MGLNQLKIWVLGILLSSLSVLAQDVTFEASVQSGCAPLIVSFTDNTDGANIWEWKFGNGNSTALTVNTPVSAVYTEPGIYTVTLIVNSQDSAQIDIEVFENPVASFTTDVNSSCPPFNVGFEDQTTSQGEVVSWFWNFGDGSISQEENPLHLFENTGTYNISLNVTDTNGCFHDTTISDFIEVLSSPVANFSADNQVACAPPLDVNFSNLSTGNGTLTYEWLLGDGSTSSNPNPSNTYTEERRYDVTLIVNDDSGCPDTLVREDFVGLTSMTAGFTYALNGCGPSSVSFTDTSGPKPNQWSWSFPGATPSSSTRQNPTANYPTSGTKQISLTATNEAGCQETIVFDLEINPAPVSIFSADDTYSCESEFEVNFIDFSSNAVSWEWDFGDGDTSMRQSPSHTFEGTGEYTVSLTTYNEDGCSHNQTFNRFIEIFEPVANFTYDVNRGCIPLEVQFNSNSVSKSFEAIEDYEWIFEGANSVSSNTDRNPLVEYNSIDSFDVTLIITNSSGCTDTVYGIDTIMAGDVPVIDFDSDPTNTCADSIIEFTHLTVGGNYFFWDFGDNGTSELENPSHIYSDTGFFDIQLIVGNNGCFDTLIKENEIYILPPIALWNSSFDCDKPFEFNFTDRSIDAEEWHWDFGDGDTSILQNPTHVYDTSGFVRVRLTVKNGACENDQLGLIILADPQADFDVDSTEACLPMDPGFNDLSTDAVQWTWVISDTLTLNGQEPSHDFDYPGIYDVKLIVTGANACMDSIEKADYFKVNGAYVDFRADTTFGCTPFTGQFEDMSIAPDGIAAWDWSVGDGTSYSDQDPSHTYDLLGSYTVNLEVEDNNGCISSERKIAYMTSSSPSINITSDDMQECPGLEVLFTKTAFGHTALEWDFGDGLQSNDDTPAHIFTEEGVFKVFLTGTNIFGCQATDSTTVTVSYPNIEIITTDSTTADCPSPPVVIQFQAGGDATNSFGSWLWDFGDGNSSTFQNPFTSYSSAGDFDVSLTYTTPGGCTDSVVYDDFVSINGPSGTIDFPDTADCAPLEVQFIANAVNTDNYSWDFGDGTVVSFTTQDTIKHTYLSRGERRPQLILHRGSCNWTVPSEQTVNVSVIPVDVEPDVKVICSGDFVDIEVSVPDTVDPIQSIQWTPSHSLSSSNTLITRAMPDSSTNYVVIVTDINGCIGPDTVSVLIDSVILDLPAADGYCPADSVQILLDTSLANHVGGNYTFQWTPSLGLSNPDTAQPFANPVNQTNYTIVVQDSVCSASAQLLITPFSNPNISVESSFLGICYGNQDTMNVFGASTYSWSPTIGLNSSESNSPIVNSLDWLNDKRDSSLVQYQVIGTDDNGCKDTTSVAVKLRALPIIPTPDDTAVCHGESVAITVDDSSNSYLWFPAEQLSDSTGVMVVATPDFAEFYNVIGVDQYGCYDTSGRVFVNVHELPDLDYNGASAILKGQSVTLLDQNGLGDYDYRWETSNDDDLPNQYLIEVSPLETTFYEVFVSTRTNPVCTVSDTMTIVVYDKVELVTPNVFTPNGDGENDEVYAYVKGVNMNTYVFRVFNRWGQVVFETSDLNEGWDGTRNGTPLQMDTYMIYVSAISLIGDPIEYTTDITLIR